MPEGVDTTNAGLDHGMLHLLPPQQLKRTGFRGTLLLIDMEKKIIHFI